MKFIFNEASGDIDSEDGKTFARLYYSNRGDMSEAEFDAVGNAMAEAATKALKDGRA